jgi:hypothetical protein
MTDGETTCTDEDGEPEMTSEMTSDTDEDGGPQPPTPVETCLGAETRPGPPAAFAAAAWSRPSLVGIARASASCCAVKERSFFTASLTPSVGPS